MGADSTFPGGPIRAAYRRAGMNRSQFQRAIGVAYSTILNWERGRTRPNADHLELISRVTGVAVHELLGGHSAGDVPPKYAALGRFLASRTGRTVTPGERRTLEMVVFHGVVPTEATYHAFLVGLRMGEPAPRPSAVQRKGQGGRRRRSRGG